MNKLRHARTHTHTHTHTHPLPLPSSHITYRQGRPLDRLGVEVISVESVDIEVLSSSPRSLHTAVDGGILPFERFKVTVLPKALEVVSSYAPIAPAEDLTSYGEELFAPTSTLELPALGDDAAGQQDWGGLGEVFEDDEHLVAVRAIGMQARGSCFSRSWDGDSCALFELWRRRLQYPPPPITTTTTITLLTNRSKRSGWAQPTRPYRRRSSRPPSCRL